jgi:sulfoxide reductase heme-binding subunit YedZ
MNAWRALIRLLDRVTGSKPFKVLVFLACATPLAGMSYQFWAVYTGRMPDALGPDPTKTMLHETGVTTITLLMLSLTVTPLRRIFHINGVQRVRRMVGVWTFAYVCVHLSIWLVFDQLCSSWATCDAHAIWNDLLKRPFIFMGMAAFVMLLVLAITSTNGWQRRLKRNWGRLHRIVYVAAIAAIIHFIWIQKSGYDRPFPWMVWLAVLFGIRIWFAFRKRTAKPQTPVRA